MRSGTGGGGGHSLANVPPSPPLRTNKKLGKGNLVAGFSLLPVSLAPQGRFGENPGRKVGKRVWSAVISSPFFSSVEEAVVHRLGIPEDINLSPAA